MRHASRLWQIDARFLQMMQLKQAGLTPDAVDDEFTSMVAEWMGMDPKPLDFTEDGIAIVSVVGPLYKRKSPFESNYRSIGDALDHLLEMEFIPPVVLRIDSPGGMVDGLQAVVSKVAQLAERTLVVASVEGCCCSAAYRIASQAGSIWATADSEAGSIGTFWQFIDYSAAFEKAGLKSISLTTGPFKGLGVIGEPITTEQETFLQDRVNSMNQFFLNDITAGRGIRGGQLDAIADGRFWPAAEAKDFGLIDEIGSLSDVLAAIRSQKKEALNMPKQTLRPVAQANAETEPDGDTTPPVDGQAGEESTPEQPTETPVTDPEPSEPTEPSAVVTVQRSLSQYMEAFGDAEGARMFRDGIAWDQAQTDAIGSLRGQIQDLQAENSQLKSRLSELGKQFAGGEERPLACGERPTRKSFGEACRAKQK